MAVTPTYASPNIGNYIVGRGYMTMQLQGENSFQDMGNITMMEFLLKPTLLDHYSSRVGIRTKDLVVVTELAGTLNLSLEEFTARNVAIALMSTPNESGSVSIDAFTNPLQYAAFEFFGTNAVGPQWSYTFPLVILSPSKAVSMIPTGSGSWGTIDMQADILKDPVTGQFMVAHADDFT